MESYKQPLKIEIKDKKEPRNVQQEQNHQQQMQEHQQVQLQRCRWFPGRVEQKSLGRYRRLHNLLLRRGGLECGRLRQG